MEDKAFLAFINSSNTRSSAPVFNLNTRNVTRRARDLLATSPYRQLAKQHINQAIVDAYTSNDKFRAKLDEVMASLNIQVVAPVAQ